MYTIRSSGGLLPLWGVHDFTDFQRLHMRYIFGVPEQQSPPRPGPWSADLGTHQEWMMSRRLQGWHNRRVVMFRQLAHYHSHYCWCLSLVDGSTNALWISGVGGLSAQSANMQRRQRRQRARRHSARLCLHPSDHGHRPRQGACTPHAATHSLIRAIPHVYRHIVCTMWGTCTCA